MTEPSGIPDRDGPYVVLVTFGDPPRRVLAQHQWKQIDEAMAGAQSLTSGDPNATHKILSIRDVAVADRAVDLCRRLAEAYESESVDLACDIAAEAAALIRDRDHD